MAIPADDLARTLVVARPDTGEGLLHLGFAGDVYTILVSGKDTEGKFCLIDMYVPPGGGPPPHRHDFEETFSLLEGELEVTFRGQKMLVQAGETINIPANAPHQFRNSSDKPVRMLCLCSPSGNDELFEAVGVQVATRTSVPPPPTDEQKQALAVKLQGLLVKYKTEILPQA